MFCNCSWNLIVLFGKTTVRPHACGRTKIIQIYILSDPRKLDSSQVFCLTWCIIRPSSCTILFLCFLASFGQLYLWSVGAMCCPPGLLWVDSQQLLADCKKFRAALNPVLFAGSWNRISEICDLIAFWGYPGRDNYSGLGKQAKTSLHKYGND